MARLTKSVAAVACLSALATACSSSAGDTKADTSGYDSARSVHSEGKGPLSTNSGSIEAWVVPYPRNGGFGSMGDVFLCRASGAGDIVLDGVRTVQGRKIGKVSVELRTVKKGQIRLPGYTPYISTAGRPPTFDAPHAIGAQKGEISEARGAKISSKCPVKFEDGYQELLITVGASGSKGGEIKRFFVDYEYAGKPYSLLIDKVIGLCGTERKLDTYC
jgi:hypothetical protein